MECLLSRGSAFSLPPMEPMLLGCLWLWEGSARAAGSGEAESRSAFPFVFKKLFCLPNEP